jgi:hypothetical protein
MVHISCHSWVYELIVIVTVTLLCREHQSFLMRFTHQQQIYHKCNKYFQNVTLSLALPHSQTNTRHKPNHNSHGSYKPAPPTSAIWTD